MPPYAGEYLRELGERITWTSRLKVTSVLHELPPVRTGRAGRPKTKGARLGTAGEVAKTAIWRKTAVRRYGRTDTVRITEISCLWYGPLHTQVVRVVLVLDEKPRSKDEGERGYGLALVTTDLACAAEDLVARYAARWGIEQSFADARAVLGVGEARNRLRTAVERTVPFALVAFSLVTVWYALSGHSPQDAAQRKARSRWYTTKAEPSYEDMVIKLRRVIIAARFSHPGPYQPQPEETRAVLLAWAAAET